MIEENQSNFIILILSTIIFLIGTLEIFSKGMLNYTKYLGMLIPIIYTFNMPIIIDKKNSIIVEWLFIYLFFELIINLFRDDYSRILMYIVLNILFVIYIAKVPMILNSVERITSYMYYVSLSIVMIILIGFIQDPILVFGKHLFNNVIINDGRERFQFGFSHPNYLGSVCLAYFINVSYLFSSQHLSSERKKILVASTIFIAYILLLSGSRTSTYTYCIFVICIVLLKLFDTLNGKHVAFIIGMVSLPRVVSFIKDLDLIQVLNHTNRFGPLYYNVQQFMKIGTSMKGLGFYNHMNIYSLKYSFLYIDNYYIYLFITQGYIGIISMSIVVILMLYCINQIPNKQLKHFIFSLLILILIYAMFETAFFVPGAFLSFYFWTIFYAMVNVKTELE